jgi:biopolymer transport protein ExbD
MRLVSRTLRPETDMDSTLTPMIDVVFLLLVFFVWTSSFQSIEEILPSRLTAQSGGKSQLPLELTPEQDFDQVVVHVGWSDGEAQWKINDSPIASATVLGAALDQIHAVQPDAPIVVHPTGEAPLALVIQAYDLSRLAGFSKVSLAADLSTGR